MDALHHAHVAQLDVQAVLSNLLELAAIEAGQTERDQIVRVGPLDGAKHVGAVARAADGNRQVARRGVVHQLLQEDLLVAKVIAHRHDPGGIVREAEDLEPPLAVVDRPARRPLRRLLKHVRDHHSVPVKPVHDPPRPTFIDDP